MNCIKKKTLFVTTAFLGIGGYILYQNLKTRIDDLEEEIWGMEDSELEVCPYCERVYTMEDEVCDDFGKVTEEIVLEKVELNNTNNELHDEVQNHLKDLEEEQKHNTDEIND
jgi:hypothetical protein